MVDFTVAIPTYNGAKRLPQLLDNLRAQAGTDQLNWEILVVDNNSSDNTADIVRGYEAKNSSERVPVRYAFEKRQGAAFARVQAMLTASSPWVGFLDDDVVPDAHWVASAYAFGQEHPKAGAYGGQIHGEFEVEPPDNFNRIKSYLALRERGSKAHRYDPDNLSLPPSASWVVQAKAWHDNVPDNPSLGGRANGSMTQGDDYEPLLRIHRAGWEIWYAPDMHVAHQIPASRMKRDYLMSLSWGCGICICSLRMVNASLWQRPFVWVKLTLSNLRRVVLHWLKYRTQLESDLVAACEMQFFLASFSSPFYYLKTILFAPKT
ncbi:MAG: hormogonium polysaccharide biosynthesis glycosyltransferase HpsE [Cyanobacteria bacterium P01_F01_bin.53]